MSNAQRPRRRDPGYRPVEERVRDFRAVELRLTDAELNDQATRCLDCGTPFCHGYGCPLGNVIPEMNAAARRGRWQDAVAVLARTNPFPEFTGRICPAPCEAACVMEIHEDPVTIRQIELTTAEKGFERGFIRPQPPEVRLEASVAVVGSGPAGLAVAQTLARRGYTVTVFENAPKPGGILRYGIPDFKLEKWVVDRRLQLMRDEGVVFESGVEIGRDVSHRYLAGRFDAVVLTGGAREPRELKVPGRELRGICLAMSYLVQQNRRLDGETVLPADILTASGKRVVVIGGGDTGADCLGTALRQGARSVHQLEILPEPPRQRSPSTPWPQWPLQLRESSSHKEGGQRLWGVTVTRFEGIDGKVSRVRGIGVEWVPQGGRMAPREKPGTEFALDADLVLLAMGFVGAGRNPYVEELGIALDERGFIRRGPDHMTSVPGIFVAGDMTRGASLVVRAMGDGLRTAVGIDRYLSARSGAR